MPEREPKELVAGYGAVRELFRTSLFQPDSVYPIELQHSHSLILIQTEVADGSQIRCIVVGY